jgi:hypothetical protein
MLDLSRKERQRVSVNLFNGEFAVMFLPKSPYWYGLRTKCISSCDSETPNPRHVFPNAAGFCGGGICSAADGREPEDLNL